MLAAAAAPADTSPGPASLMSSHPRSGAAAPQLNEICMTDVHVVLVRGSPGASSGHTRAKVVVRRRLPEGSRAGRHVVDDIPEPELPVGKRSLRKVPDDR